MLPTTKTLLTRQVPRGDGTSGRGRVAPKALFAYREAMALSFGVTVLPDPPYQRMIELLRLAEQQGFDYGWTYDSHVLW
jgi:hypothetical protein